jgi:hypothetical protein
LDVSDHLISEDGFMEVPSMVAVQLPVTEDNSDVPR